MSVVEERERPGIRTTRLAPKIPSGKREEPYVPMTLGVIQGYKAKLEEDLTNLIRDYEELTGTKVTYIHISRVIAETIGSPAQFILQRVETSVAIP